MKIAGFQELSLIDFPKNLAAVIFTQGCNFRCPFCHNPQLIPNLGSGEYISEEDFFKFLDERHKLLDGVTITGGEPLLQENIEDFIKKIKDKGFLLKLDTNGLLFDKLNRLVSNKMLDYIAMDFKSSLNNYDSSSGVNTNIEAIKKSINLIMGSGIDYEFRTTVVAELHKKEDILKIAEFIQGGMKYVLQKFEVRDKIFDDKFLKASSITREEAFLLKDECEKFVKKCELRGWD